MSTRLRLRRKQYNSLTDSESGIVVFDYTTKKIHVAGDEFYPIFKSGNNPSSGIVPAPRSTSAINASVPKILCENSWQDITNINYKKDIELYTENDGTISIDARDITAGVYITIIGDVTMLEITNQLNSFPWESFIKFRTAFDANDSSVGNFEIVLDDGTIYAGSLQCEAGTTYIISIIHGMVIMHSINVYSSQS